MSPHAEGRAVSPFMYDVQEPLIWELSSFYKGLNSSLIPGAAPEFSHLRNEMGLPFPRSNKQLKYRKWIPFLMHHFLRPQCIRPQQAYLVPPTLTGVSESFLLMAAKLAPKEEHTLAWGGISSFLWNFQLTTQLLPDPQAGVLLLVWREMWCIPLCSGDVAITGLSYRLPARATSLCSDFFFTCLPPTSGFINRGDSFLMKYGPWVPFIFGNILNSLSKWSIKHLQLCFAIALTEE